MNNTRTLAIVTVLTAATLVVGGTLAATTIPSAFAYLKKVVDPKKDPKGKDNGNDGNTVTTQANKQKGSQSGYDNSFEQSATNLICTHPGENYVGEVENPILCLNEQS
ncbi:MAG TPA: hypothetical protein VFJ05_04435 [Nitrososphaeraceae archaeon]|nr:hypothetical protein [Nitrososphaeraceae archaeon]